MDVRPAEDSEVDALARLWYDGWQDGHALIVPAELARLRTLESFTERMRAALPEVRTIGEPGRPAGFHMERLIVLARAQCAHLPPDPRQPRPARRARWPAPHREVSEPCSLCSK